MRFEQLEYLIAIAETNSFNAAAQELFVSQQAISIAMKQLEQELGQQLFVKESNKTVLSDAGKTALNFAKKILQEQDSFLQHMKTTPQIQDNCFINICSSSCALNMLLPSVIVTLQKTKNISAIITSVNRLACLLERVANGEMDIGLISINEFDLKRQFSEYDEMLQMDVLANDKIVGVINRKNYNGNLSFFRVEDRDFMKKTLFNIEISIKHQQIAKKHHCISSSDADFHRAMLNKSDVMVMMTGLSYRTLFNKKNM